MDLGHPNPSASWVQPSSSCNPKPYKIVGYDPFIIGSITLKTAGFLDSQVLSTMLLRFRGFKASAKPSTLNRTLGGFRVLASWGFRALGATAVLRAYRVYRAYRVLKGFIGFIGFIRSKRHIGLSASGFAAPSCQGPGRLLLQVTQRVRIYYHYGIRSQKTIHIMVFGT